jgi:hypothetical protein
MLAAWRKPPGEEPEGSRASATSLVVDVVRSKAASAPHNAPFIFLRVSDALAI